MKSEHPLRVLIAEDSPAVQDTFARTINAIPNVRVETQAFTGRAAIAALRKTRPDIALIDLSMPDGSGFEVLETIRRDEEGPLLIVITFHSEAMIRARCFELGAHLFIDKADDTDKLFDLLARLGSGEATIEEEKESANCDIAERHE